MSCKPGLKNESVHNLRLSISLQEKNNNDIYIDINNEFDNRGSSHSDTGFFKPFLSVIG